MWSVLGIGFSAPWLLLGLLTLPLLWLLLRAIPPAPVRQLFPGVALLLGLRDESTQAERTPWWLLLLRAAAMAAAIIGFAGPVVNPKERALGKGPLLVVFDGGWADARDWSERIGRASSLLGDAARDGRTAAVVVLTDLPAGDPVFLVAGEWVSRLAGFSPHPWDPDMRKAARWIAGQEGRWETVWFSDGLAHDGRGAVLAALEKRGPVRVTEGSRPIFALRPAEFSGGAIKLTALRASVGGQSEQIVRAIGLDPAGRERELARANLSFADGKKMAQASLNLPPELRNRISRFEIADWRSAGAVTLADDALRRRKVAIISGRTQREGLELLSPTHYLRRALEPTADLIKGSFSDILLANPDVIILADVARLAPTESQELLTWVQKGGLLLRFAGPRLAASDVARSTDDPLVPVRLRAGGRTVGGAMSWGEPKSIRPFDKDSPFAGLAIPKDVKVSAQVMAQPGPDLSGRVIAALTDGTPLVTRKLVGTGQVVLFHVTANAEWSTLPLSGLFVQMLERLAVSSRSERPSPAELAGTVWQPVKVLDGFGALHDAGAMAGVTGERIAAATGGPELPPGLYKSNGRVIAVNVIAADQSLAPSDWPARIPVEGLLAKRETQLKGWLLLVALVLLAGDVLASLWLSGRMRGPGHRVVGGTSLVLAFAVLVIAPPQARAQQDDELALEATTNVVLAYARTGNARVDAVSEAGLRGLSDVLFSRTSVEPADPIGVDLESDELAFFPVLYWPITESQPLPSAAAYVRLNDFLRTGGMIVFDTRDGDIASLGQTTANARKLQQLAAGLDIPPLERVPKDHVLTRTFYLLQDFPGRFDSPDVWVEAAPPDAQRAEGMPFRNLDDNVSPVVIGANDWAAAWAVDRAGNYLFPVGRGTAGERQREIAYRFGVNLVMYVLTGNYKSDQVHVPALLERLGQ